MNVLIIRHVAESDPPLFQVLRPTDGKCAPCHKVPSPVDFPVEGRPDSNLRNELAWYLERFLDYPYPPETDRAERVQNALGAWGRAAYLALFSDMNAIRWFGDAIRDGLDQLELRIVSDDPRVLAWPWEALYDPQTGLLAHTCLMNRRVDGAADPPPLSDNLPKVCVNVLLVTCRPGGEQDVGLCSISRPLVELVEELRIPVHVTLLRPPTFEQLRRHLRDRPDFYHIVHFDCHGVYGRTGAGAPRGHLAFETADGSPDLTSADDIAVLLREFRIPAVVLNACQSAMIDERTEDPFASIATSLIKAGVRRVIAMSYSLYVSAAQEFLPEFYNRLFSTGSFEEATRAGRQRLRMQRGRVCAVGRHDLDDWLVPVLYTQGDDFLSLIANGIRTEIFSLPPELLEHDNPYGFVGRDNSLLQLERAMHRKPAVLLITGLGGSGKTTLAHGFVEWLLRTNGLDSKELFWFRFDEIQSADYVLNRLGERLISSQFAALDDSRKLTLLLEVLRHHRHLIVWDNFESAHGIEGTAVTAKLSPHDRDLLAQLARGLCGGKTKIVMTSRSNEVWLAKPYRFKLSLKGLTGEERWLLCETTYFPHFSFSISLIVRPASSGQIQETAGIVFCVRIARGIFELAE